MHEVGRSPRSPGTCCPFRYSRTVRRLIPRCRAIADFVQPRAYSACASTVVSHVSIPTGSFDGSGGQIRSETTSVEGARLVERQEDQPAVATSVGVAA